MESDPGAFLQEAQSIAVQLSLLKIPEETHEFFEMASKKIEEEKQDEKKLNEIRDKILDLFKNLNPNPNREELSKGFLEKVVFSCPHTFPFLKFLEDFAFGRLNDDDSFSSAFLNLVRMQKELKDDPMARLKYTNVIHWLNMPFIEQEISKIQSMSQLNRNKFYLKEFKLSPTNFKEGSPKFIKEFPSEITRGNRGIQFLRKIQSFLVFSSSGEFELLDKGLICVRKGKVRTTDGESFRCGISASQNCSWLVIWDYEGLRMILFSFDNFSEPKFEWTDLKSKPSGVLWTSEREFMVAFWEGEIRKYEVMREKPLLDPTMKGFGSIEEINQAGEPDSFLFITDTGKAVKIHFGKTDPVVWAVSHHSQWARCISYSEENGLVASGGNDNRVYVMKEKTGEVVSCLSDFGDFVRGVRWSPNGECFLALCMESLNFYQVDSNLGIKTKSKILKSKFTTESSLLTFDVDWVNYKVLVGDEKGRVHSVDLEDEKDQ